ncbi:MAG: hypothetical protein ACTHKB_05365 [Burkholderiaceae bacterium]
MRLGKTRAIDVAIHPEATVIINAARGVITYERPHYNLIRVRFTGEEQPEMGRLFFTLLDLELGYDQRCRHRDGDGPTVHLFVDAKRVSQHGLMFESWIQFLLERELPLRHIHILAVNKTIALSVQIIQHLSDTGTLVRLYDTPACFHAAERTMLSMQKTPSETEATARRLGKQLELSRKLARMIE